MVLACSDTTRPTEAAHPIIKASVDLFIAELDRVVTEDEFAIADKDKAAGICVKGTTSDHLLMKDANAATPCQPCPAGWYLHSGKGEAEPEKPAEEAPVQE